MPRPARADHPGPCDAWPGNPGAPPPAGLHGLGEVCRPGQTEREAFTTIVLANVSWKPCLVGLWAVVYRR